MAHPWVQNTRNWSEVRIVKYSMFKKLKKWWWQQKDDIAEMAATKSGVAFANQMFRWISYDSLKSILDDPKIKERGYVDYGYLCDRLAANIRRDSLGKEAQRTDQGIVERRKEQMEKNERMVRCG